MNSAKRAAPDHPIQQLLVERYSPYGFAERTVSKADLLSLFEAARWAASSYNEQPWSYILAMREDGEQFQRVLSCLLEANQAWAKAAPVLAIGCTRLNFTRNGQPNRVAIHDLGLASANLSFEATARGLAVHQMAGIVPEKVREIFQVPPDVQPETGLAIGYAADPDSEPEPLRQKDSSPRTRKPLSQFVYGDKWGTASKLVT